MQDIPFDFETSGFSFHELPWSYRWFNTGIITDIQQAQIFDDEGAGITKVDGVYYTHPVALAAFIMTRLDQYTYNSDPRYLDLCIRQAERLIERSFLSRDAAYIPYEFPWNLHRYIAEPMPVPWFSGMAQGHGLSAFSRLYEVTGEERYLEFAHLIFQSFFNLEQPGTPWITKIVNDDNLWFEEYARDNGPSDGAFNGHLFGAFGLHDYWMATKDPRAVTLADGAYTAVLRLMDLWRFPGGQSYYCFGHRTRGASYHHYHIKQLGQIYNQTADPLWVRLQDLFLDDYPMQIWPERPNSANLLVKPGTYRVGVRGDLSVTTHVSKTFTEERILPIDVRGKRTEEMTPSVRVNDPDFEYMWFTEMPGKIYVTGVTENEKWVHPVTAIVTETNPTLFTFDARGETIEVTPTTLEIGDQLPSNERARIQGENWLRCASGKHEGLWIAFRDVQPLSS